MGVKRQQEVTSTCTVVLVGDPRVGKTALVNRLIANKFSEVRYRQKIENNIYKVGPYLLKP